MWKGEKPDEYIVILDRTIFHPQGGGQPSDDGYITNMEGTLNFTIKVLKSDKDAILHTGTFSQVTLPLQTL